MRNNRLNVIVLIIFIIIVGVCFYYIYPFKTSIKLGLDLQGGAYALVSLDYNSKVVQDQFKGKVITQKDKDSLMDSVIIKIENRINRFGLSETSIQKLSQQDKILISLPGVKEATELRQIIETVGILEFKLVSKEGSGELRNLYDTYKKQGIYIFDDKEKKLLPDYLTMLLSKVPDVEVLPVSSKDKWGVESEDMGYIVVKKESLLKNAKIESANVDQNQLGQNVVDFTLDDNSAKTWAIVTEQAAKNQDQIAIILDNTVLHSPSVREKIPNGRSQITLGDSPLEVLNTLALILRSGSLDVPLEISEENTVGASLGRDTIEKGVWAIFFGVIFVFGFMILYYSGGGLIANFTVVLNILLLMAGYSLFKATLTLPGIAGIILTVGMAVDANVIIYERIKEEFRSGKTFKTAVSLGFDRAFWTILDSNLTTFAAGIGLSIFGTGAVKGFAVSLCLGIVTTLFASLFGTRLIFESLVTIHEFKSIRILTFFNVGGAKK